MKVRLVVPDQPFTREDPAARIDRQLHTAKRARLARPDHPGERRVQVWQLHGPVRARRRDGEVRDRLVLSAELGEIRLAPVGVEVRIDLEPADARFNRLGRPLGQHV